MHFLAIPCKAKRCNRQNLCGLRTETQTPNHLISFYLELNNFPLHYAEVGEWHHEKWKTHAAIFKILQKMIDVFRGIAILTA